MLSLTEILIYLSVTGIGVYLIFGRKRKNFPPGPPAYPIIGNILSLAPSFHLTFWEHSKKYGPISTIKLGLDRAVILHDVNLIKEAFNDNLITGRPPSSITEFLAGAPDGILQAEGRTWVDQRRFALRTLRDFGFGRKGMESLIMDEVKELVEWIGKQNGKPLILQRRYSLAVVNALWKILTGERYDHDDQRLTKILEDLELTANAMLNGQITALLIGFYPRFAKLISKWSGWDNLVSLAQVRLDLFDRIIEEHKKTRCADQPRDFIDVYFNEVDKMEDTTSSFHHSTASGSLRSVMSDLFLAGSDTTSTTISWVVLYLIHDQEVLGKLHEEIDRVVGRSRFPSLADRSSLPYTEAFLMEALRKSSIVPGGVGHCTMEDITFHGYDLPKGTPVLSNIYAVHHDPLIWGDPEEFRPERFLSPDKRTVQKHDCLIPFSVGKRICLGFNLALDELFLFTTCLVQRFDISADPGASEKPTLEPNYGQITLATRPYSVIMKERA